MRIGGGHPQSSARRGGYAGGLFARPWAGIPSFSVDIAIHRGV